jgi:molybdopterin-containing oxidoreductase family iron-sulfur binding subunit
VLINTLASPSTEKLIAEFIGGTKFKHIVYDVSSSETLDAFEAVYGERALVDYDFSKLHLLFRLVQIFLVTGKVEVMIRYTQGRILKRKDVTPLSIRGEYDAVWCGC